MSNEIMKQIEQMMQDQQKKYEEMLEAAKNVEEPGVYTIRAEKNLGEILWEIAQEKNIKTVQELNRRTTGTDKKPSSYLYDFLDGKSHLNADGSTGTIKLETLNFLLSGLQGVHLAVFDPCKNTYIPVKNLYEEPHTDTEGKSIITPDLFQSDEGEEK